MMRPILLLLLLSLCGSLVRPETTEEPEATDGSDGFETTSTTEKPTNISDDSSYDEARFWKRRCPVCISARRPCPSVVDFPCRVCRPCPPRQPCPPRESCPPCEVCESCPTCPLCPACESCPSCPPCPTRSPRPPRPSCPPRPPCPTCPPRPSYQTFRPREPEDGDLNKKDICPFGGFVTCNCDMDCPDDEEFVCGSDGVTYQNECFLKQARCEAKKYITISKRGACGKNMRLTQCPKSCAHVPTSTVCNSDGYSLNNICQLKKDNCGHETVKVYHRKNSVCT